MLQLVYTYYPHKYREHILDIKVLFESVTLISQSVLVSQAPLTDGSIKGIVQPKIRIQSSITHHHVVPNLQDLHSSLKHKLRYFWWNPRAFWPCIDSNTTSTFKAQKGNKDIVKIVHVRSVFQPKCYEAMRTLFFCAKNTKLMILFNNSFSTIMSVFDARLQEYHDTCVVLSWMCIEDFLNKVVVFVFFVFFCFLPLISHGLFYQCPYYLSDTTVICRAASSWIELVS